MSGIRAATALAVFCWVATAHAQDAPFECDDQFDPCGTPEQSGGGGGGGGGSILINNTDLGDSYQYADDYDDDGIEDPYDNCPWDANPDQIDDDGDQVGTSCDNCPQSANTDQANLDGDVLGNSCDDDIDGDGVKNSRDICIWNPPLQKNEDNDAMGDACDDDIDGDGVPNLDDNCVMVKNPNQANTDPDYFGDACDDDDDSDGIRNTWDNCLGVANYDQKNADGDSLGDACDADLDGDMINNNLDNCPRVANSGQLDLDRDGVGESCDDRFCFVVNGDVDNCLDPTDPFKVYSPTLQAKTGEKTRLRLFGNHANQALRYDWILVDAPKGSKAKVLNPSGSASISTPYEYHYLANEVAEFKPDVAGTYTFRLVTELAWEDAVTGETGVRSEYRTTLEATGEDKKSSGCTVAPMAIGTWMLPLFGLVATRRRK